MSTVCHHTLKCSETTLLHRNSRKGGRRKGAPLTVPLTRPNKLSPPSSHQPWSGRGSRPHSFHEDFLLFRAPQSPLHLLLSLLGRAGLRPVSRAPASPQRLPQGPSRPAPRARPAPQASTRDNEGAWPTPGLPANVPGMLLLIRVDTVSHRGGAH